MGLSSEEKQMLIDLALEQDSFGRYSVKPVFTLYS